MSPNILSFFLSFGTHSLMIDPWERIDTERRGDYKVFSVRQDLSKSPASGREHTFYVIESTDWVNIIPVTVDGRIVFIRQYRHGTEEITLEVPGGMVDPGESPAEAALREMQEETGYDAQRVVYLGSVAPNPAIQNNQCHTFLALDARLEGQQELDGAEEISVTLVEADEVPGLITSGRITHALVVTAFYFFDRYRAGDTPPTGGGAASEA